MKKVFILIAFLIGTNWAFYTNAIAEDVTVKKINVKDVDYTNRLTKDEKGVERIEIVDARTGGVIATVDADESTKAQLLSKPQIQGAEVGNPIVGKNDVKVTKINVEGKDYIKRKVKDGKGVEKLELVNLHTGQLIATIDVADKGGEVGNPIRGSFEEYFQALNSDPRFDHLKKAAAGDKNIARVEVGRFVREYCEQTKKCSPFSDLEFKDEVAVAFAKIHLKTVEQSNKKYAEALIEFNKQLSECQEKTATLFSQDFKESCSEEIVCEGKKAERLQELFKEYNGFEKSRVGVVHRELSEEEKMVGGVDISFMLNKPVGEEKMFDMNIDAVYPKFSMASILYQRNLNTREKKMFSTKTQAINYKEVKFDKSDIPNGIMALRALKCSDEKTMKGDNVKIDDYGCRIYIGNTEVAHDLKEKKTCLVPEEAGFIASFKNLFKKKKDSVVEVNDSDRGKVKAVEIETSGAQQKVIRSSER